MASALLIPASAAPPPTTQSAQFASALKQQQKSLQQQEHALFEQTGIKAGEDDFIPPLPVLVKADCDPLPHSEIEALIAKTAQRESLDPALIRAVMRQESGFRPCAVSNKGAEGLMQLMPATAKLLHVPDPFDPAQNVAAGAELLKQLLTRYNGDLRLALVAYNAGAVRADAAPAGPYPAETQAYLANIFAELATPQEEEPLTPLAGESSAKTHSLPPAPVPPEKSPGRQTQDSPPAAPQTPAAASAPTAVPAGGA